MNVIIKSLVLAGALSASMLAHGAGRSATMQVSFVIVESCTVSVAQQKPAVACQLSSPYQLSRKAAPAAAAAPSTAKAADGVWEVTF